jgi:hypothetical protein
MVLDNLLDGLLHILRDIPLRNFRKETTVRGCEVSTELVLPTDYLVNRDGVEQAVDTRIDNWDLDFDWKRLILALLCENYK